jgi:hypothetical protein
VSCPRAGADDLSLIPELDRSKRDVMIGHVPTHGDGDKYPDVRSAQVIEELFNPLHAVDLYNDVVTKAMDWPTSDHSIKPLANILFHLARHPSFRCRLD